MLSILHISSARTWRGGEQQIAYLVEELHQKGITQHVFCVKDSAMENWCKQRQLLYTSYKKHSSVDPSVARLLKQVCTKHQYRIIHAHDSHAHTYACVAATLFRNKTPIVLHRRVDFPIQNNILSQWKYNHPRIQRIICVSEAIKRLLSSSISRKKRLVVVHSGVDLNRFQYQKSNILRQAFNIPDTHYLIGNVAAIAGHKDYFTFVDTVEKLVASGLLATYLIIGGDGGKQEAVEQYIAEKQLQNHIILTGFRADIPQILPELDVFLFTSKEEGLGTSVLDAFACGVPVVATKAGGIPEMVRQRETGLLALIGDSETLAKNVLDILNKPELRQNLIQNAEEKLTDFSKQKMAHQILSIYQEIIADSRL